MILFRERREMRNKDTTPRGLRGGSQLLAACAAAGLLLSTMPAHAVQFSVGHGVTGSFDTTITFGLAYRTHARDKSLIGKANLVPPAPQPGSYGILPPTAP